MPAVLSRKSAALLLLCVPGAPAPWVSLSDPTGGSVPSTTPTDVDGHVLLKAHRLHLGPYDPNVVGNVKGLSHLPLPIKSARNHALVGVMEVGTPAQQLSFMLDASGSDIWVPSKKCTTCAEDAQEQRGFYNANASKTFEPAMHPSLFGMTPVASRVLYGGGSAAGFIVRDTFQVGPATVGNQVFLIAEEGGPDARRTRSWDGVFGVGWKLGHGTIEETFYEALPSDAAKPPGLQLQSMFGIAPTAVRGEYHMSVGGLPKGVTPQVWTEAKPHVSAWAVSANVANTAVSLVIETGTSFLLVPGHSYLKIARQIFPNFDSHCGVDKSAGGIVVCDCALRNEALQQLQVVFEGDMNTKFTIDPKALLEDAAGSYGKLCIPQVQEKPRDPEIDDPFGLLGAPLLDDDAALHVAGPGGAFGLPLPPMLRLGPHAGPPGGPPGMGMGHGPFGPVPLPPAIAAITNITESMEKGLKGLKGKEETPEAVEHVLEHALEAQSGKIGASQETIIEGGQDLPNGGVVKEMVVERMKDGTKCEREVIRDANGKVVKETLKAQGANGEEKHANALVCAGTRVKDGRRLRGENPFEGLLDRLDRGPRAHIGDVWILGDLFLRNHAVVLDFHERRLGVAKVSEAMASDAAVPAAGAAAPIEVSGTGGVQALTQAYDTNELKEATEKFV